MCEERTESSLREIAPADLTSRDIADAASKNDPLALKAFDFTAHKLAQGIVNSVIFSSPRTIFLFGGLAQAGDILFNPVREYVNRDIQPIFRGTVDILPSGIPENNAAVLGAAALAWKEISY
jgi:glucokinase